MSWGGAIASDQSRRVRSGIATQQGCPICMPTIATSVQGVWHGAPSYSHVRLPNARTVLRSSNGCFGLPRAPQKQQGQCNGRQGSSYHAELALSNTYVWRRCGSCSESGRPKVDHWRVLHGESLIPWRDCQSQRLARTARSHLALAQFWVDATDDDELQLWPGF